MMSMVPDVGGSGVGGSGARRSFPNNGNNRWFQQQGQQGRQQGNKTVQNPEVGPRYQQIDMAGHSGLHIDRIPIDTLTRDVAASLSKFLNMDVLHIEDKRGQKTVHCCAFAVVDGAVDFQGKTELQYELAAQPGIRSVPGTDGTEKPPVPRMIRIQPATRRPERPPVPQPRCTLHIRIMTQRRHWAFSINGLTWAGLSCMLDLVSPGSAKNVILVADDTSEKTSQAHPENFICGFFVECVDVKAAETVLKTCGDQRVIIDKVPFRIAAEYTRKASLRLYDKPLKLRQTKQQEFAKIRQVSELIAARIVSGAAPGVTFPEKLGEPSSELNELFKFMGNHDIQRMPKWYQQRLHELGWTQPGMINANDDILRSFLQSVKLDMYYEMLSSMGVMSYLDLATLDDQLLQQSGMDKVVHRRKLLQQISELRHRVHYDPTLTGLPPGLVPSHLPIPVHIASPPPLHDAPRTQFAPYPTFEPPQDFEVLKEEVILPAADEPKEAEEEEEEEGQRNKAKMHRDKKRGARHISMRFPPSDAVEQEGDVWTNNRWTLPTKRPDFFNEEEQQQRDSLSNKPKVAPTLDDDDTQPPALAEPAKDAREDREEEI